MNQAEGLRYKLFALLVVSFVSVYLSFVWQGNKGFSLWDEGYLWYGVQRVMLGEVPIRDFMAYDPGRYYWIAGLSSVFSSDSITGVRAAVAIFQAIGLYVGLILVASIQRPKDRPQTVFWTACALILLMWMIPRHKLFDISLSIFLVGIFAYLIDRPTPRRYLLAGIGVGLAAVFGRNHGVYGAVAGIGIILWLRIRSISDSSFLRVVSIWGSGVAIGFSPVFGMAALIPGFSDAFWESIKSLYQQKATNIPIAVPWPWTVDFGRPDILGILQAVLVGIAFCGILVVGVSSIAWVCYKAAKQETVPPAFASAAFFMLPYAHFAFSRADVAHLAQGVFPILIGILVMVAGTPSKIKWVITIIMLLATFSITHEYFPGWQCRSPGSCVSVEVSGDTLMVDRATAADITLLRHLAAKYAPHGEEFIAAPYWPGAYALLERRSPMWEIYALFHRDRSFEMRELERIKASKPRFAVILDYALDGRQELRFKNTHPLTYQYIVENFDRIDYGANPAYLIFLAR
jgi:hypothetical protein